MAVVRPFRAFRPTKELAHKVAELPYDVMNSDEAREIADGNPYSFLHVDKAEIDLEPSVDIYDQRVYEKASENLNRMIETGVYLEDKKPYMYIYRIASNGKRQTGIVACTSIDDYINNVIKKHEKTRADKEEDRVNHVDYCDANTGPIFLTYRHNANINAVVTKWTQKSPEYDFTSPDGVQHTVWVINDLEDVDYLTNQFKSVDNLYIADGHHRAASAVRVGLKRRQQYPQYTGKEEFNFFLSVIFPDEDLRIMDYNRVVKDTNGLSVEELIEKICTKFNVISYQGEGAYRPEEKHTFGMYIEGKWHKLIAREGSYDDKDPVASLDVSILQDNLLSPILGIEDPRTSDRIDFIGGVRGLKELEKRAAADMKLAFSMYPTTISDLMAIADAGKIMPPKSTWFEPKPRSGIFVHKLK
ncbi:DUF1015 domain-containing protein [Clostridium oryzae]|uniref:DUF1015 domain-containing protein n=1 Tax=Clostridium oryzae TaxID=1450648 RepID=A0A1V4IEJ0_9CLOT|nr:DUF1015 family protein [Clostridium oryzae]OPJ58391.1 hypothetical protein CLORY_36210 [Clostridium oryzae]